MRRLLLLLLAWGCDDASARSASGEVARVAATVEAPSTVEAPTEEPAVEAPTEEPAVEPSEPNGELVFGRSRAAYDLSGWTPLPVGRHRPDEDFAASEYHFHYADVPGHPGVRAATNRVTLTLDDEGDRASVLRIAAAEHAEIVGQVPSAKFYQLRLSTTSFEEGMATLERIRGVPGVYSASHAAERYFATD
ncbi:MAG: hypothetical protein R3B99_33405 [Polyangiales bacterium]